jgi:DUF1009 family protein
MLDALRDFDAGYALHGRPDHAAPAVQGPASRLQGHPHPAFSLKRRNAETIFGAIAQEIEELGRHPARRPGLPRRPTRHRRLHDRAAFPIDDDYLAHGIQIARECARLDIGQGCVVRKGTVLAVEAFEGTDEMLRRAGGFKTDQPSS